MSFCLHLNNKDSLTHRFLLCGESANATCEWGEDVDEGAEELGVTAEILDGEHEQQVLEHTRNSKVLILLQLNTGNINKQTNKSIKQQLEGKCLTQL